MWKSPFSQITRNNCNNNAKPMQFYLTSPTSLRFQDMHFSHESCFHRKNCFCEFSMISAKFPVSGTSQTIDIPKEILMISRPDRKRVYFHLKFMKFGEVTQFPWKNALFRKYRKFHTFRAFLVPLSKPYKNPAYVNAFGVSNPPKTAFWCNLSTFTKMAVN